MMKQLYDPDRRFRPLEEKRRDTHYQGIRLRDITLPPNLLSLSRLVWAIPAIVLVWSSAGVKTDLWAAGLLAIAFLTDVLDGFVARTFKQISDLGKLLDPLIDKLIVLGMAITLGFADRPHQFPAWLILLIVVRDISIIVLASRVISEDKYIFSSSWSGKATTFVVALTLVLFLLSEFVPQQLLKIMPYIAGAILLMSGVDYLERYWSVRHKRFLEKKDLSEVKK